MISLALVLAATAPALESLFPHEAEVRLEGEGPWRLALPPEVIADCAPDLSDLRLVGADGREVPFAVDAGRKQDLTLSKVEPAVVEEVRREQRRREDGTIEAWIETYVLDVPDGVSELVLDTPRDRFVARVRIDDVEEHVWRVANVPRERVAVPITPGKRTVTITSPSSYLEPRFLLRKTSRLPETRALDVPLAVSTTTESDGWTEVVLARPRGLVPGALVVSTGTRWLDRAVEVWDEGAGRADALLARGRIVRVDVEGETIAQLDLDIAPAAGDRLRVRIEDRDSPPLASLAIAARIHAPVLLFEARPSRLLWGGGRAQRPSYDLAAAAGRFPQLLDPSRAREATLGPRRANPELRPGQLLDFALRPGAEIDVRRFSHRRRLDVAASEEGLARVTLGLDDAAVAREDLADVRIADESGKQWPYLLHDAAGGEWIDGAVTRTSRDRKSSYEVALRAAPFRPEAVEVDSPVRFFDRAYVLHAIDEDGEPREISRGRLSRRADDPRPASLVLPRVRAHRLRLEVEDGDDAPLDLAVRVRVPTADLFLVAPAGRYTLLLGRADDTRPVYELERVREVVLAVEPEDANAGSLEPNPHFRKSVAWSEGDAAKRIGVWAVLLAALAVLGTLAVVLARREEKAQA